MCYGSRKYSESVQIGDFLLDGGTVGIGQWFTRFVVVPFLGGFVQCLVVLIKFFSEWCRFVFQEFVLEAVGHGLQRPGNGEGG